MKLDITTFFTKTLFQKKQYVLILWILLALIAWLTKYFPESYNNFLIFKNVFWHTVHQLPLYTPYPDEYLDINHYGPLFSLIVAPFALTPLWLGLLSWLVGSSLILYYSLTKLPLPDKSKILIGWFCAHELLTALYMSQFNIATASLIILTFILIEKDKTIAATLLIAIGTFIKLYGIVGLAFFMFSRNKVKFVISLIIWSVILYIAPMFISSPDYINGQYVEWFARLAVKNKLNMDSLMQNISFLGMVRKISGNMNYSDLILIIPGIILFGLPYIRFSQYKYMPFRLTILASVLLFVVLFSTGSESSTYIIAFMGVAIWYVAAPWKRSKLDLALMIFAFILTSMSPSDLFPKVIRELIVRPYALKALPCMLIWIKLIYEMMRMNYDPLQNKGVVAPESIS